MPYTYFGPIGERNNTYAAVGNNANLGTRPLGTRLVLPDEREYRFVLNDGTAEVAASLYQSVASVANHVNVVCDVARAVDAVIVSATLGATAAAIDIYAEGIVHVNDAAGEGYAYNITRAMSSGAAHAAAASSGILTVNLAPGEKVQIALTTSSEVSFTRNRYHQVLIHASPPTGGIAGVSPGVAAADRFYWSQTKGYAAVLADGTLLAGLPVMASIGTDGAVENFKRRVRTSGTTALVSTATHAVLKLLDQDGTTTNFLVVVTTAQATANDDISGPIAINGPTIGVCVKANASTEQALVDLAIQG